MTDTSAVSRLPSFTSVTDVADACRRAYLELVRLGDRAERADLARWAAGPYADVLTASGVEAVRHHVEALLLVSEGEESWQLALGRACVRNALVAFNEDRDRSAVGSESLVVRAADRFGGTGYAPVARGDASLASRAIALVLVDFLTRPFELVRSLRVDHDSIHFEARPSRESGFRRRRSLTLRGLGPDEV